MDGQPSSVQALHHHLLQGYLSIALPCCFPHQFHLAICTLSTQLCRAGAVHFMSLMLSPCVTSRSLWQWTKRSSSEEAVAAVEQLQAGDL